MITNSLAGSRAYSGGRVLERINAPGLRAKWQEHYHQNPSPLRRSFAGAERAYRFGAETADSLACQGKDWSRVAQQIRAQWIAEHGAHSWQEVEGAVRWGYVSYQEAL